MGIFSKFENKMEDTFDNIGEKMFDAPISPVQIAKKAEKQMRRGKMVGAGKEFAPTLYTILVNPDDDARLFGYYPTLAGETETYLKAKANEAGLEIDGQPLVRFIVDDALKHGKFDVIAETVASAIVEQLRQEEIERYGIQNAPQAANNFDNSGANNQADGNQAVDNQPVNNQNVQNDVQPENVNSNGFVYESPFAQAPAQQDNFGAENGAGQNGMPDESMQSEQYDYPPQQDQYSNNQQFDNCEAVQNGPAPQAQPAPQSAPAPSAQPIPAQGNQAAPHQADFRDAGNNQMYQGNQAAQFNSQNGQNNPSQNGMPDAQAAAPTQVFAGGFNVSADDKIPVNNNIPPAHLRDTSSGKVYTLNSQNVVLGRENTCSIVLGDANASRQHAQIQFANGVWMLNDLGSTNGTFINNQEITSRQLNNGDVITIGVTNLAFNIG